MNTEKEYFAFISYKREDQKWAKWLQETLENYKLPSVLNGRTDLPKEIRPVFRDKSELASGVLADEIQTALKQSKYLIVICSPRSAQSEWVNKEIQSFIDLGRTEKIIPFIIEGRPHAQNPDDECFPSLLRNLPTEQELLGIEVDEMGRDAAAVKVVAQMFGLQFDSLWQRHERQQKRRRNWAMCVIAAFALLVMGVAGWIWHQNTVLKDTQWKMLENQSKLVAEKVISLASEDSYLARRLALEILPKDLSKPNRPYTPEAERALRMACEHTTAIMREPKGRISDAKFTSDDKQIISYSIDSIITIKIWDVLSGSEIKISQLPCDSISGYCLSNNGQYIAITRYSDSTLIIFDTETGNKLISLTNSSNWINPLAFSLDGEKIVTLAYDSTFLVRSTHSGAVLMKAKEPFSSINTASFSSDGELIALASSNNLHGGTFISHGNKMIVSKNIISIYEVKSGKIVCSWQGHNNLISSISFSPNNKQIVTASYDGTIKVWETQTGKEISTSSKVCASLTKALFSIDGKNVISSAFDGIIYTWDAQSGEEIQDFAAHCSVVNSLAFSSDGNMFITSSDDNTIRLWNWEQSHSSTIVEQTKIPVYGIDISSNRNQIATMYDDTTLTIINVDNYKKSLVLKLKSNRRFHHHPIAFSPDGNYLISNYDDLTLYIWELPSGKVFDSLTGHEYPAYSVAFSPTGEKVVSALMNAHLGIWDIRKNCEPELQNRYRSLSSACFSPDGKIIYLLSEQIEILNAENYEDIGKLTEHKNYVSSLAFCNNSKTIVSSSNDKALRIWDTETGSCIMVLNGHLDRVNHAAFSPDGRLIASASSDNTIRIWEVASGSCVHILEGHTDDVTFVEFLDNERLISASSDSTIRQWPFPPLQELIDQTRERFKDRPLTAEERKMYYLE